MEKERNLNEKIVIGLASANTTLELPGMSATQIEFVYSENIVDNLPKKDIVDLAIGIGEFDIASFSKDLAKKAVLIAQRIGTPAHVESVVVFASATRLHELKHSPMAHKFLILLEKKYPGLMFSKEFALRFTSVQECNNKIKTLNEVDTVHKMD